jgi:hypothetical protein
MSSFIIAAAVVALALVAIAQRSVSAADAPSSEFYVLKGDYGEIAAKGTIRFLVHGEADYLPRSGDPLSPSDWR